MYEKNNQDPAIDFGLVIFGSFLLASFFLLLALLWVGGTHDAIVWARSFVLVTAFPVWLLYVISDWTDEPKTTRTKN
jgi:hypothetical protein